MTIPQIYSAKQTRPKRNDAVLQKKSHSYSLINGQEILPLSYYYHLQQMLNKKQIPFHNTKVLEMDYRMIKNDSSSSAFPINVNRNAFYNSTFVTQTFDTNEPTERKPSARVSYESIPLIKLSKESTEQQFDETAAACITLTNNKRKKYYYFRNLDSPGYHQKITDTFKRSNTFIYNHQQQQQHQQLQFQHKPQQHKPFKSILNRKIYELKSLRAFSVPLHDSDNSLPPISTRKIGFRKSSLKKRDEEKVVTHNRNDETIVENVEDIANMENDKVSENDNYTVLDECRNLSDNEDNEDEMKCDEAGEEIMLGSDHDDDDNEDFDDIIDGEEIEENIDTSLNDCETASSRDEPISELSESLPDVLLRYGYDFNTLMTVVTKYENGQMIRCKPPLTQSLFVNVPPTVTFTTGDQRISEPPFEVKRLLKWKMCSITPTIVRTIISRSSFSITHKNDWLGIWGRHMKPEAFKNIREYQKVNHFPGSFQIGRKDRLCRNLYHAQSRMGKSEYNFIPVTYVLPQDYVLLKNDIENPGNKNNKWILKPPASARGQGIRLIGKLDQVPKKRACVVQRYLANPYLINGLKFDLRIYVHVASYDPLRVYIFSDGLTRFASRKFSNSTKTIGDKYMHLTNFSINRTNSEYKSNDDLNACQGHKWSLKALWGYLKKQGINTERIWEDIKDLVVKTIIVGDPHVNVLVKGYVRRKYSVHELFGFDVILDENLKPWIIEVNISPSLHSTSPLDVTIKGEVISDLFNIAGITLPNVKDLDRDEGRRIDRNIPRALLQDRRVMPQQLSSDERAKHQFYITRWNDDKARKTITDVLTPDDIRMLVETEDELSRRGNFICIFPTADSHKYLKFFETPRYYNLLLVEWLHKYRHNRNKGLMLLNHYCKKRIHMQNPTDSSENQWSNNKVPFKSGTIDHSIPKSSHQSASIMKSQNENLEVCNEG